MKKQKVLVFLPHLSGGGAERVTLNIIKQLNIKKFEVLLVILTKEGPLLELIPEHINIIELNIKKTIFSFLKLRRTIHITKPDIIFSSLFRSHIALYFSLIGFKNKPKVILRSPNSPKLLLERGELSKWMKKLLDVAYKNADTIIAQTPEMKEEISQLHNIQNNKIEVLLNPIDKELIDNKIKNIDNPFDNNKINIVAAGRIIEQKGFDILIQSINLIKKENTNFKLYIIGEDVVNEKVNLEKLTLELDLNNYVEFLGFQSNPYKYFYYSDLYVLSSRWEGLPNTVLENLYLEKPIVATKCIPFMNELIDNNKNGILVEVENKEQLADAILSYNNIIPKNYTENNSDINSIFNIGENNELN